MRVCHSANRCASCHSTQHSNDARTRCSPSRIPLSELGTQSLESKTPTIALPETGTSNTSSHSITVHCAILAGASFGLYADARSVTAEEQASRLACRNGLQSADGVLEAAISQ
jgi:hypothetical protein